MAILSSPRSGPGFPRRQSSRQLRLRQLGRPRLAGCRRWRYRPCCPLGRTWRSRRSGQLRPPRSHRSPRRPQRRAARPRPDRPAPGDSASDRPRAPRHRCTRAWGRTPSRGRARTGAAPPLGTAGSPRQARGTGAESLSRTLATCCVLAHGQRVRARSRARLRAEMRAQRPVERRRRCARSDASRPRAARPPSDLGAGLGLATPQPLSLFGGSEA